MSGLQSGENRRRADAYLSRGYGGLVGFELKGGVDAGRLFIDSLKLLYHVANIGDARSLAIHPAHQQLTPEEQCAAGVTPGYVRLSVGLGHPEDILDRHPRRQPSFRSRGVEASRSRRHRSERCAGRVRRTAGAGWRPNAFQMRASLRAHARRPWPWNAATNA